MGPAALDQLSARTEEQAFVDYVLAIALAIARDYERTRVKFVAHPHRREALPLLARMQVAVNIWQIPIVGPKHRGMQNQGRCVSLVHGRITAILRIVVPGARAVLID